MKHKGQLSGCLFFCQVYEFIFLSANITGPMLIKESIIKVARTLKEGKEIDIQDKNILEGYPEDLSEADVIKAMNAIDIVSDVLLDLE